MSSSSFEHTIKLLIDRLARTGILEGLELSDENIADSIWLALKIGKVKTPQKPKPKYEQQPEQLPIFFEDSDPQPVTEREPQVSVITEESIDQTPEKPPVKGLPFQTPAAPALRPAVARTAAAAAAMRTSRVRPRSGRRTNEWNE